MNTAIGAGHHRIIGVHIPKAGAIAALVRLKHRAHLAKCAHGLPAHAKAIGDTRQIAAAMNDNAGINIAGAIRMAREMGPGHRIVTILCDYGTRYQSKLFNPAFLKEKGLPVPRWLDRAPMVIPSVFLDA